MNSLVNYQISYFLEKIPYAYFKNQLYIFYRLILMEKL